MKRILIRTGIALLLVYAAIHALLASHPVQQYIVGQIRSALYSEGLDLTIESVDVSAFIPRLYLSRVTLSSTPQFPIQLTRIAVDKIRMDLDLLGLLYRKIIINEAVIYHPRFQILNADILYKKLSKIVSQKTPLQLSGDSLRIEIKTISVVDAIFEIGLATPPIKVTSNRFTSSVTLHPKQQVSLTIVSTHLTFTYANKDILLQKIDIDADVSAHSLRLNRAIVEGPELNLNIRGVTSIPSKGSNNTLNLSYELKVFLPALHRFGLTPLKLGGEIQASGTAKVANQDRSGNGQFAFRDVVIDGYRIESGSFTFDHNPSRIQLQNLAVSTARGTLTSDSVQIKLDKHWTLEGKTKIFNLRLESLLSNLKTPTNSVEMSSSGEVIFSGTLRSPLKLNLQLGMNLQGLHVLDKAPEKKILDFGNGSLKGMLTFLSDRMNFLGDVNILGGRVTTQGSVSFDNHAKLSVAGNLSLSHLKRIEDLQIAGNVKLSSEVEVLGTDAQVSGFFEVEDGEFVDLVLGKVKGRVFFRNALLSFEQMELASIEPVRASGFVDFRPKKTDYRFTVDVKRTPTDQALKVFQKSELSFLPPKGGELSGKVSIRGGHDKEGVEVIATGQGRGFAFYGEDWSNGQFALLYRKNLFELTHASFFKPSGVVEAKGRFTPGQSTLSLATNHLKIEELNWIGRTPLAGTLAGELELEGEITPIPKSGSGKITLSNLNFRGAPISGADLRLSKSPSSQLIAFTTYDEKLRLEYVQPSSGSEQLDIFLSEANALPWLGIYLKQDLSTLSNIILSGNISLSGEIRKGGPLSGRGRFSRLSLGLSETSMQNTKDIQIEIENGKVTMTPTELVGLDSRLDVQFAYSPNKQVTGSLSGKIDLQYLQPFLPLDYGRGKVSGSLKLSGLPNRFILFGNASLSNGDFRIHGLKDEFLNTNLQLGVSADKLTLDLFETHINGGRLTADGSIGINRFHSFAPNLQLHANRIGLKPTPNITTRLSGELSIRGEKTPYLLGGECRVHQASITSFDLKSVEALPSEKPVLRFDVRCTAPDKIIAQTDVIDAEFKGNFQLTGNSSEIGLLGSAEAIRGNMLFRETQFALVSGNVRFESSRTILPRFNVSGRATVQEQKQLAPRQFEVTLQAFGHPKDYRIRLTSAPPLAENEIIALLLLGVTSGSEGNYLDLGSTLVGQIPIQSRIQKNLGVNIKVKQTKDSIDASSLPPSDSSGASGTVTSVKIEKGITKKTKVSYSNTLDAARPKRELKVEHMLNENFTVNGTAATNVRSTTTDNPSYGVDVRYTFEFE